MNKLFFAISIFAYVFAYQAAQPACDVPGFPRYIALDSKYRCEHSSELFEGGFCCVEYRIYGPGNKISPLSPCGSTDLTFIAITIYPEKDGLCSVGSLVNTNASGVVTFMRSTLAGMHIRGGSLPMIELLSEQIKFTLRGYLRQHVLTPKYCLICSKAIESTESVVFLNCGAGAHKSCLSDGGTKRTCFCGKKIEEEIWWSF